MCETVKKLTEFHIFFLLVKMDKKRRSWLLQSRVHIWSGVWPWEGTVWLDQVSSDGSAAQENRWELGEVPVCIYVNVQEGLSSPLKRRWVFMFLLFKFMLSVLNLKRFSFHVLEDKNGGRRKN